MRNILCIFQKRTYYTLCSLKEQEPCGHFQLLMCKREKQGNILCNKDCIKLSKIDLFFFNNGKITSEISRKEKRKLVSDKKKQEF